ncbi:MAG: HAMP domain-containing protein, partial [Anaerolineales bacterium]|nr:HAMP domain-containing protein [Anaerolineales bacterium]
MSKNSWSQKIVHQSERIRLQTKFILAFLFVSLFAVTSVAYVTNYTTSRALIDAVGNDLKNLSNSQGVAVGDLLLHQVELLQSLSLNEILINKANLANALYGNDLAAIQTVLQQKDTAWKTVTETDRVAQIILTNTASDELLTFRNRFPNHVEIFITDRYGALLAASNLTSDYYQGDEGWWQHAYNNGKGNTYMGMMPNQDVSSGTFSLIIAVPIYEKRSRDVIGILRTTYSLQNIGVLFQSSILHEDGLRLSLLLPNNLALPAPYLSASSHAPDESLLYTLDDELIGRLKTMSFAQMSQHQVIYLASLGPVTTIDANPLITSLSWSVVAQHDRDTALDSVRAQQRSIWMLAVLLLGLTAVSGVFAGRMLSNPILRLTAVAQQIRDGNLQIQAAVESQDEIGELAQTFNNMTRQMRLSITQLEEHRDQLEHRVAARTADLERQTKTL